MLEKVPEKILENDDGKKCIRIRYLKKVHPHSIVEKMCWKKGLVPDLQKKNWSRIWKNELVSANCAGKSASASDF